MPQRIEVLPAVLLSQAHCTVCLRDGDSALIHKRLPADLLDVGVFVQTPIVLHLLQGRQHIRHHLGAECLVNAGDVVHLPKGVYAVSDFVAGDQPVFEAMVYALAPALLHASVAQARHAAPPQAARASPPQCTVARAPQVLQAYAHSATAMYGDQRLAGQPELARVKLTELLHLLGSEPALAPVAQALMQSPHSTGRASITQVMDTHWAFNLRVQDYASLCGCSESAFTRQFKRIYRQSPRQWLLQRRLESAHQLLQAGRTRVQDAAEHAGYRSVSHFIGAYKRVYGCTPKQTLQAHLGV